MAGSLATELKWSDPVFRETKRGPRLLRIASATPEFWQRWQQNREGVKAQGMYPTKDKDGNWEVVWWQEVPKEPPKEEKKAIKASKALSANIDVPCPKGLKYMPFQKAGIAYALDKIRKEKDPSVCLIADEMGL